MNEQVRDMFLRLLELLVGSPQAAEGRTPPAEEYYQWAHRAHDAGQIPEAPVMVRPNLSRQKMGELNRAAEQGERAENSSMQWDLSGGTLDRPYVDPRKMQRRIMQPPMIDG